MPGDVAQLSVAWSMPPAFFQQAWRAWDQASAGGPEDPASDEPMSGFQRSQVAGPVGRQPGSRDAELGDASDHMQRLAIDAGGGGTLPQLMGFRKGAGPSVVPRVDLIAEGYAWLLVALAPCPGDDGAAWTSSNRVGGASQGSAIATIRSWG